ncbi:BT_3987 domain-containing protein [Pontibacter harenae]|uniref:BT_3987 domain-containing protein n=1 Tax=Pontibacter harenae TaxID=2894083 RepID=UPI001E2904D6|nr:DUF1735 domain-containing protein [Pontibacter harenae]MCC9167914.1 DUF1735 domain-containing protein [Pontibacter harenae]
MKLNYKFNWLLLAAVLQCLYACSPEEFEVPNAASFSKVFLQDAIENPVQYSYAMKDEWHSIKLGVGYGGVNFQNQDITVNLEATTALVDEFNALNGTDYPAMPEGSYRISANAVVLAAGKSSSNSISIEVNPLKLTGPRPHLLPVTIKDVSGDVQVNEELKTVYYLVSGEFDENPYEKFSQENWTVHSYSSDENDGSRTGGRARHSFDGSLDTFWHSQWRRDANGNRPGHPHFVAIDMNESKMIHGLEIFGRVNQVGGNGNPRDIVVEISTDGESWVETDSYVLENTASNTIYFPTAMEARYFRITINASHQDVYRTHVAEIKAF